MKHAAQQENYIAPTLTYVFADDLLNGAHGEAYGLTLTLQDLNFTQLVNNCFRGVSFLRHDPVLQSVENTNLKPGPVFSG